MLRRIGAPMAVAAALFAASLSAQTPALGPELPVNQTTAGRQRFPSVAVDPEGNFVVTWASPDGDDSGIFARRFDTFGGPLSDEIPINTYSTGTQTAPRVAVSSNGNFVVVWNSYSYPTPEDGSGGGVFGRLFDASGEPLTEQFQVNVFTPGYQSYGAVAMNASGKFVVVWQSNAAHDGDQGGIFARRYDADGTSLGDEFQINLATTGYQGYPAVAIDSTGAFVVVWASRPDDIASSIIARQFDSSGAPLGPDFQVSADTVDFAIGGAVSIDDDGHFVIVWQQSTPAVHWDIRARSYTGPTADGPDFRVNVSASDEWYPFVALTPEHDVLVAWNDLNLTGGPSFGEIRARRFRIPGIPIGDEFVVNAYTTGAQRDASVAMNNAGNFVMAWDSDGQDGSQEGVIARRGELYAAQPMLVDAHPSGGSSDLNGVLEPGETVQIEPAWTNTLSVAAAFAGTASELTGPAGPTYSIDHASADYGSLSPGATADCLTATGVCYVVAVSGARPAPHWDATFTEALTIGMGKTWTLHVGESFADVTPSHPFYTFVENLFHNGVTGGCGAGVYCPGDTLTRAQVSALLLKAEHGATFVPPACSGVFPDVPCPSSFADWIEQLAAEGITGGCGGGNYCPSNPVTRQQMAVLLLKAKYGSTYVPPACAGLFGDVPCPSQFADWIEDLSTQGITGGCGSGNYCPLSPNTRGQMAVFLVKTFGLLLYGP